MNNQSIQVPNNLKITISQLEKLFINPSFYFVNYVDKNEIERSQIDNIEEFYKNRVVEIGNKEDEPHAVIVYITFIYGRKESRK